MALEREKIVLLTPMPSASARHSAEGEDRVAYKGAECEPEVLHHVR